MLFPIGFKFSKNFLISDFSHKNKSDLGISGFHLPFFCYVRPFAKIYKLFSMPF